MDERTLSRVLAFDTLDQVLDFIGVPARAPRRFKFKRNKALTVLAAGVGISFPALGIFAYLQGWHPPWNQEDPEKLEESSAPPSEEVVMKLIREPPNKRWNPLSCAGDPSSDRGKKRFFPESSGAPRLKSDLASAKLDRHKKRLLELGASKTR